MNRVAIILCSALVGCSAPDLPAKEAAEFAEKKPLNEAERAKAIERIEATVKLPPGAASMDEYSRNYGIAENGKVHGVYAHVGSGFGSENTCEGRERRNLEQCTIEERATLQRLAAEHHNWWIERFAPLGESRWIGDFDEYPFLMDGGCLQIQLSYDLTEQRIEWVSCNGTA